MNGQNCKKKINGMRQIFRYGDSSQEEVYLIFPLYPRAPLTMRSTIMITSSPLPQRPFRNYIQYPSCFSMFISWLGSLTYCTVRGVGGAMRANLLLSYISSRFPSFRRSWPATTAAHWWLQLQQCVVSARGRILESNFSTAHFTCGRVVWQLDSGSTCINQRHMYTCFFPSMHATHLRSRPLYLFVFS